MDSSRRGQKRSRNPENARSSSRNHVPKLAHPMDDLGAIEEEGANILETGGVADTLD